MLRNARREKNERQEQVTYPSRRIYYANCDIYVRGEQSDED